MLIDKFHEANILLNHRDLQEIDDSHTIARLPAGGATQKNPKFFSQWWII